MAAWGKHHGRYTLACRVAVPEEDLFTWGAWLEQPGVRRVAETQVGPLRVSTVFLGLDHSFDDDDNTPPVLFETMIFDGGHDDYQTRCATWAEAEAMHADAVAIAEELWANARKLLPENI